MSGISLTFDNENKASTEVKNNDQKQQCFGGVMCDMCQHIEGTIELSDKIQIKTERWLCKEVNNDVLNLEVCPLKRWVKLAGPPTKSAIQIYGGIK
jgi:hypothetical protein